MDKKDPKNSVRDEQFSENTENTENNESKIDNTDETVKNSKEESDSENNKMDSQDSSNGNNSGNTDQTDNVDHESEEKEQEATGLAAESSANEKPLNKSKESEPEDGRKDEKEPTGKPDDKKSEQSGHEKEVINYSLLDKTDMVKVLDELLDNQSVNDIRDEVDAIKVAFYKKYKAGTEQKKKEFIEQGGNIEDFKPSPDPDEMEMKDLLKKFRDLRQEYNQVLEKEKEENLAKKYKIIEEIKDLVNRDESINKTFQEFRDLQRRWHEVGIVPQKNLKDLWENYHYHVEKFYDYIKINKELRDLDLRKNLELKIELCEKAEELLLEPNIVNAFKTLQNYHDRWREIGPVPKEKRTELWDRFKDATSKINKKHQQFYQDLKKSQKKNLESKTVLCDKAEELANAEISSHEEWVKHTNEIFELQKVWKTIGFAPKKDNNRIYARFRKACDTFFDRKREFYAHNMEEQQESLQKKLDLCVQAEALKDSTDWKKTTRDLINLQKRWKTIGPVPRKDSDDVWRRFRAACDHFFNRKSEHFSNIDRNYDKNLEEKEKLIREIQDYQLADNLTENMKKLNDFQRRWSKIGFVPYKNKDEIMQKYREALNQLYDNLKVDDHKKNILKFRNKLENILQKPRPEIKLRFEREKLMNKLTQLKNDIGVWENNIGFFANTDKAESMVSDFEQKIEDAKKKIKMLEDKVMMIDEVDPSDN